MSEPSHSVVPMHYYENTGRVCEHCREPISYQVVKTGTFGGEQLEHRRGPRCWMAGCPGNQ